MIKYIILGIVQGLTEFLPVSSSGHLVVLQKILGINAHEVAISITLHLGTLLAVVIFFWKDILSLLKNFKLLVLVAITVIITGAIGVLGKDFFESVFTSPKLIGIAWIFTGLLLISTKKITQYNRNKLNVQDALILGLTQALAIIPGISRSGTSIATLFFRKVDRTLAFTFSFLVSIPIILGAAILERKELQVIPKSDMLNLVIGLIFSFFAGLVALLFLKRFIAEAKFYYFGYYCLFCAAFTLLFIK